MLAPQQKRGRPKLNDDTRRQENVHIRLTNEELMRLKNAASAQNMTLSGFILCHTLPVCERIEKIQTRIELDKEYN